MGQCGDALLLQVQHGSTKPLVRELLQLGSGSQEEAEVERMVKQYTAVGVYNQHVDRECICQV
jgi:hypothetical protein